MAIIKLNDLMHHDIPGADLFKDSENYMKDLSEEELTIQGGATPATVVIIVVVTIILLLPSEAR